MTTGTTMVGWVDMFKTADGYGFVSPMGKRPEGIADGEVFIHVSRCRMFKGVPEMPSIGTERVLPQWVNDNIYPARRVRSGYSWVVMSVSQGRKGPEATAWAILPPRRSVADILRFDGFDNYRGTDVAILPTGRNALGGLWGELEAWTLNETCLELTLASPRGPNDTPTGEAKTIQTINFIDLRVKEDNHRRIDLVLKRKDEPSLRVCFSQKFEF